MEYFTSALLVVMSVGVVGVTGDTVHLTMVTPTPYGAGSSQSSSSISCFRSAPDGDVSLSFGRPFQLGLAGSTITASTTLPSGSSQSVNGQIVTQDLTTSNNATGLFYCQGSSRGLTTRVYSIIHSVNRRFEPVEELVTKTINKEEDVTLTVSIVIPGSSPIWRRTRNGTVNVSLQNRHQTSFTVSSADAVDGDLYTVIASGRDLGDNHFSVIRLIVRGCVANKWGPSSCTEVCDMCYNGGVCDDETGDCICPPGFSGPNCLTACGMHRFGWGCEFQCGSGDVIQSCTGSQFGLPDPYGNSCISGYHDSDCGTVCSAGSFGAGCTQTCHCQSSQCNAYTGECTGTPSGCAVGWSGTNCQIPDICPAGYYGANCLNKCHCSSDAACDKATGYCSMFSGACAAGFPCISSSSACPAGLYMMGASCSRSCHCLNNAACDLSLLYCVGSDGECEEGFQADASTTNCLFGITEFQAVSKTYPGQDVEFSCAGSSVYTFAVSDIILSTSADGSTGTHSFTFSSIANGVLTNTFFVSGLQHGQTIYCIFSKIDAKSTRSLSVEFWVPPALSQPPNVSVNSTSATVSWQAWDSVVDTGDGPVTAYFVYYSLTSPAPETFVVVQVTDPTQTVYSSVIQLLQSDTEYMFSVAALREGPGGIGPRSPATTRTTLPASPASTTKPTTQATEPANTIDTGPPIAPTTKSNTTPPTTQSSQSTRASTTDSPGPTTAPVDVAVIAVVAVVVILVIVILILVVLLIRRYRRRLSKTVSMDDLKGKFESSNDLSNLEAVDNPVAIPLEDINANGDVGVTDTVHTAAAANTTTTTAPSAAAAAAVVPARPTSGTSLVSMLDSSSPFAGLPLYPPREREMTKEPVPLKEFVGYVHRALQGPQLREEWSSFPGLEAICSCDVSQLPDNKTKNRYRNIPAYDHCRVILEHDKDDQNLGYINACYIKGYKDDKAYIATQGPNQATSHDFWKMVWQENVRVIVNGTNLVEDGKIKCHKYWPDVGKAETLGGILISAISEEFTQEYIIRKMTVAEVGSHESRKVTQFHYITWPDKNVPKDVTPVLQLVKDFSEASPIEAGPFLVHCSAGVGRTGAIIAIHASLKRARAEKTLDVYNFVADMRDHRVSIVQTPIQYAFIHSALLEALFSVDTTVPAASLQKRVAELKKKKRLAEEFEQLNTITPIPNLERCRNSMANVNQSRNRFAHTLAPENCRPFLMTPREIDGVEYNYINASFVDGFKQTDFAVVTQAPLPDTVVDLWRLVYDYQISNIVMLNALDPNDPGCPQYWPDRGSKDYGPFTVTVCKVATLDGYSIKQMILEHRRQKRSLNFKHYQLTDWPLGQEVPDSPSALLRLIHTMEKYKTNKNKFSSVLVHCIDGLDRSGVFCVLKSSLDRLKETDTVDIMQTTKVLRLNRPNILSSLGLYRFCYEAMLAYVNNPDDYKAEVIPEPVYENTPLIKEKEQPPENIYQNLDSSQSVETGDLNDAKTISDVN